MTLLEEDLHERPTVTYETRALLLYQLLGVEVTTPAVLSCLRSMGSIAGRELLVLKKHT